MDPVPPPPDVSALSATDCEPAPPAHTWFRDGDRVELIADAAPGELVTVRAVLTVAGERVEWSASAIAPSSVPLGPPSGALGRAAGDFLVPVFVEVTLERDGVAVERSPAPTLQAAWTDGPDRPPVLWTAAQSRVAAPHGVLSELGPLDDPGDPIGRVAPGTWATTRTWRSE